MAGLRDALLSFRPELTLAAPTAPSRLAKAHRHLERLLGETAAKQPDRDALRTTYRALRAATPGSLAALPLRHLRRAPWVMFQPQDEGARALADEPGFLAEYVRALAQRASASAIVALVACLLYFYPAQAPYFSPLRQALRDKLLPLARGPRAERWQGCVGACGLLEAYGDPRLVRGEGWAGVDPSARQAMLRWLVETTLDDFFRLLEHAARNNETARRHWHYRKAFWAAYLQQGHIHDAWVALGRDAKSAASRFLSHTAQAYGDIAGPGVLADHSVLLLTVGDLTITEWSHSGKYRIWFTGNAYRPRLYRAHYSRDDVTRGPDVDGSHHGTEKGTWQSRLADLIREHTGIAMAYRHFMP